MKKVLLLLVGLIALGCSKSEEQKEPQKDNPNKEQKEPQKDNPNK